MACNATASAFSPFRDFAAALYARPGVAPLCLDLQDNYGADVNLLLFACWHAITRGPLEASLLSRALAFSRQWQAAVVAPLRESRRGIAKPSPAGPEHAAAGVPPDLPREQGDRLMAQQDLLRREIAALEIRLEQFQEDVLESLCSGGNGECEPGPQRAHVYAHISANLRACLGAVPHDPGPQYDLSSLIDQTLELVSRPVSEKAAAPRSTV